MVSGRDERGRASRNYVRGVTFKRSCSMSLALRYEECSGACRDDVTNGSTTQPIGAARARACFSALYFATRSVHFICPRCSSTASNPINVTSLSSDSLRFLQESTTATYPVPRSTRSRALPPSQARPTMDGTSLSRRPTALRLRTSPRTFCSRQEGTPLSLLERASRRTASRLTASSSSRPCLRPPRSLAPAT